ncbi:ribose-phosphate pyrophosphokinase 1 [Entomophthora muscae]|uniref:Ribose-phosphate pyrophosphokinase 1 n=1 Tax=Entomophthora muscae TaxID=34485 RepID=A0ACC2TXC0_9FUNG|nr:ribose-phosphate pyrophosphokinase 1 [Entomophthora muscae]
MRQTKIFSGSSHPELAALISERLGHPLSPLNTRKFSNGETGVEIGCSVRNEDVYLIQSGSGKVNDNLMELLILVSACKTSSARRITAVLPYFPYSKQSKAKNKRSAITAKMIANMLTMAGVDHIITLDLHSSQMQGFFNKPVDNLYAEPAIANWIRSTVPDYCDGIVVSKNAGGAKRVTSLADTLDLDFALIHNDPNHYEKNTRPYFDDETSAQEVQMPHNQPEYCLTLVGDVKDKVVFVLDDIIDKCGSFVEAADYLMKVGKAKRVIIIATHGVLSGDALVTLEKCQSISQVVVTNTYPIPPERRALSTKLVVIDISTTLSEAIRRTHNGESISFLFNNSL